MKLIINIDDEMYKRICEAQSVPDMYGTDIVNAINIVKKGTPVSTDGDFISRKALRKALEVTQYNDIDDLTRTEQLINNALTVEPSHLDSTPTVAINKDFYKTDKSNPINRCDLFQ